MAPKLEVVGGKEITPEPSWIQKILRSGGGSGPGPSPDKGELGSASKIKPAWLVVGAALIATGIAVLPK